MARKKADTVVLLSVRPKFAEALMAGTKRVEFRRVRFRRPVRAVVVYATAPVARVVGYFEVAFVQESSPSAIWRRHARVGGISPPEYKRYYAGSTRAVAIGVGKVSRLPDGLTLNSLERGARPPQSFRYLSSDTLARLHLWGLEAAPGETKQGSTPPRLPHSYIRGADYLIPTRRKRKTPGVTGGFGAGEET
jgi:predicted transcriptional regulator